MSLLLTPSLISSSPDRLCGVNSVSMYLILLSLNTSYSMSPSQSLPHLPHYHPSTPSVHPSRHITDTPASEREFLENLHELDHKVSFMKEQDFNECRAVFDVRDVVEKLKLKAVDKIRVFLLQKIFQFRRPMANYQMLQNQLLNYRYSLLLVEWCVMW